MFTGSALHRVYLNMFICIVLVVYSRLLLNFNMNEITTKTHCSHPLLHMNHALAKEVQLFILMGKSNTIVSACTMYRHLQ